MFILYVEDERLNEKLFLKSSPLISICLIQGHYPAISDHKISFAGFSATVQVNKNWPFEQGLFPEQNDKLYSAMKSDPFWYCVMMLRFGLAGFVFLLSFILDKF